MASRYRTLNLALQGLAIETHGIFHFTQAEIDKYVKNCPECRKHRKREHLKCGEHRERRERYAQG